MSKKLEFDGVLRSPAEALAKASRKGAGRRMTIYMHDDLREAVRDVDEGREGLSESVLMRYLLILGIAVVQKHKGRKDAPQ
jgi:hypothetical protein